MKSDLRSLLPTAQVMSRVWLFLILALTVLVGLPPKGGVYDYHIHLVSAWRAAEGEIPHLDFQALYGPLQHLLVGHFVRLLGLPIAFGFNLFLTIAAGVTALVFFVFLARLKPLPASPRFALLTVYLLFAPFLAYCAVWYCGLPMLWLAFLALVVVPCLANTTTKPVYAYASLSGFFIGLALMTRVNFGLYAGLAFIVASVAALAATRHIPPFVARALGSFTGFCVAGFVGFLLGADLVAFFNESVAYVSFYAYRQFSIPDLVAHYPWEASLVELARFVWFTLFVSLLFGLMAVAKKVAPSLIFFVALGLCFLHYFWSKPDYLHAYPFVLMSLFGFGVALNFLQEMNVKWPQSRRLLWLLSLYAIGLFVFFGSLSWNFLWSTRGFWKNSVVTPGFFTSFLENGLSPNSPAEEQLREKIESLGLKNGSLVVSNVPGASQGPNDVGVNISLYLRLKMRPTTYYWFFDPPFTLRPEVQEHLSRQVEDLQVPAVIELTPLWTTLSPHPTILGNPPEPDIFHQFLRANYHSAFLVEDPDRSFTYELYLHPTLKKP